VKYLSKVFVVDDDPSVRSSLAAVLTLHGYNVKCFSSAESFLSQHHPTQVGCVLVDLAVLGASGGEMISRLQETGSLLSVVITTGLVDTTLFGQYAQESTPSPGRPDEVATLLTMVEDAIAGSVRRRAKRTSHNP
jgi:FixJ family two-component response regulator